MEESRASQDVVVRVGRGGEGGASSWFKVEISGRERGVTSAMSCLVWETMPPWGDTGPNNTCSGEGTDICSVPSLDSEPAYRRGGGSNFPTTPPCPAWAVYGGTVQSA